MPRILQNQQNHQQFLPTLDYKYSSPSKTAKINKKHTELWLFKYMIQYATRTTCLLFQVIASKPCLAKHGFRVNFVSTITCGKSYRTRRTDQECTADRPHLVTRTCLAKDQTHVIITAERQPCLSFWSKVETGRCLALSCQDNPEFAYVAAMRVQPMSILDHGRQKRMVWQQELPCYADLRSREINSI